MSKRSFVTVVAVVLAATSIGSAAPKGHHATPKSEPPCIEDGRKDNYCAFLERDRPCSDSAQCGSGVCWAPPAKRFPVEGTPSTGTCGPHMGGLTGCHTIVIKGKAGGTVCRD